MYAQTRTNTASAHSFVSSRPPVKKVYGSDRIGIVGFHDRGFVIAKPAEPHAAWLQQRSQTLHEKIGGCTNITDGLRQSLELIKKVPKGILRRIWLLSDGHPNIETDSLNAIVDEARQAYCNINTIGFGNPNNYDENLLRNIASSTHNGKFVPVTTLRQLTDALIRSGDGRQRTRHHHRSETTILAIDLSYSMRESMENTTKIAVVETAVMQLLLYKQRCFA
ncbi:MAG: VWA domain-containing protein [Candidatus Omnitrophota bacterium]|jgi:Mg-chelatase subunit ChlD|nr:MAG: VWA domain-containing protein [Candidatus Omnitrophota bacterium]